MSSREPRLVSGPVVVCGLGNLGFRVVQLLYQLGVELSVITLEARDTWLREARELGAHVLIGDARDPLLLRQAGIERASALIAATDRDLVNLEIGLDARRMNAKLRLVLRVFDLELGQSLERALGSTRAIGSSALAGPQLAWAALGQTVLGSFEFGGKAWLVARVTVEAGSALSGLSADAAWRRHGLIFGETLTRETLEPGESVTLVAERDRFVELGGRPSGTRVERRVPVFRTLAGIWSNAPRALRAVFMMLLALTLVSVFVFELGMNLSFLDAFYYVVTTVTTTGYGDITPKDAGTALKLYACLLMGLGSVTMAILYSFATDFVVSERVRSALGRPPAPPGNHVVVVGLGNVGYRALAELVRTGAEVAAVDRDVENEFAISLSSERRVVAGDGRLEATLRSAGAERARAVVAATGDDAVNLAAALAARRLSQEARTVVRVFDADFAQKIEDNELASRALSASRIAAPFFAAAALFEGVLAAYVDGGRIFVLRQIAISEAPRDRPAIGSPEAVPLAVELSGARVERVAEARIAPDAEKLLILEGRALSSPEPAGR